MKDSIGMVPALVVLFIGIAAISGYIAFTVNYSKAFKAKSRIVNIIQEYENDIDNGDTLSKIKKDVGDYLKSINYSSTDLLLAKGCREDQGWQTIQNQGWCYKIVATGSDSSNEYHSKQQKKYIKIRTFISIDVPIFNKFFANIPIFYVDGSTKTTTTYK